MSLRISTKRERRKTIGGALALGVRDYSHTQGEELATLLSPTVIQISRNHLQVKVSDIEFNRIISP
jgi:hypothetical protein